MPSGYLIVETVDQRPDAVRIRAVDDLPKLGSQLEDVAPFPGVQCIARFNNVFVARMHAHTALRRRTLDAEEGLYQVSPVVAVAAVDAIDLQHALAFLSPEISADPALAQETGRRRRVHERINRFFNGVGVAAILLLIALTILTV